MLFSLGVYFALLVIVMALVFGAGRLTASDSGSDACGCSLISPAAEAPTAACMPVWEVYPKHRRL